MQVFDTACANLMINMLPVQFTDLYKYSLQMPYLLFTANHIM